MKNTNLRKKITLFNLVIFLSIILLAMTSAYCYEGLIGEGTSCALSPDNWIGCLSSPLRSPIISEYLMNESSGTAIQDSSGNENDGVLNGGGVWTGGGLIFDGVDDHAHLLDNTAGFQGGFSVEFLLKINEAKQQTIISSLGEDNGDIDGIHISLNPSNQLIFWLFEDKGYLTRYTNSLPLNEWLHLIVTWDFSKTGTSCNEFDISSGVDIYVNGVKSDVASSSYKGGLDCYPNNLDGNYALKFGIKPLNLGDFFKGEVNRTRIFNRALTPTEINETNFGEKGICIQANCSLDSDCGNVTYSSNFCIGGDVHRNKTTPTCVAGNCEANITSELVETCSLGCSGGVCNSDTTAPIVLVYNPLNNFTYNDSEILINFSAMDNVAMDSLWYFNDTTNVSYNGQVMLNLSEGIYNWIFYANDSSGNVGSTPVMFVINLTSPAPAGWVSFISPTPGDYFEDQNILVEISAFNETDTVWWNNGTENLTYVSPINLKFKQGTYTFIAYANSSNGTIFTDTVSFDIEEKGEKGKKSNKKVRHLSFDVEGAIVESENPLIFSETEGIKLESSFDKEKIDSKALFLIVSGFLLFLIVVIIYFTFLAKKE